MSQLEVGLSLLVLGLGVIVGGLLHHSVRAVAAARRAGPVRRVRNRVLGWIPSVLTLAGLTMLLALTGPPEPSLPLLLLIASLVVVLLLGGPVVSYIIESVGQVSHPEEVLAAALHPADTVRIELAVHRARYQPPVARSTLGIVRNGRFQALAWAERPAGRTRAECIDPRLLDVARASGRPLEVVPGRLGLWLMEEAAPSA